jgi:hypothetical protein
LSSWFGTRKEIDYPGAGEGPRLLRCARFNPNLLPGGGGGIGEADFFFAGVDETIRSGVPNPRGDGGGGGGGGVTPPPTEFPTAADAALCGDNGFGFFVLPLLRAGEDCWNDSKSKICNFSINR